MELLGGNGVDTSMMFPVADLCFSLSGLGESEPPMFPSSVTLSFLIVPGRSLTFARQLLCCTIICFAMPFYAMLRLAFVFN